MAQAAVRYSAPSRSLSAPRTSAITFSRENTSMPRGGAAALDVPDGVSGQAVDTRGALEDPCSVTW